MEFTTNLHSRIFLYLPRTVRLRGSLVTIINSSSSSIVICIFIGYSPSLVGWTEIGHQIQSLSKVCQNIVQCLSKDQKSTRSVQSSTGSVKCLSRVCRVSVQFKSSWTEYGYGNPGIVQTLSYKKTTSVNFQI